MRTSLCCLALIATYLGFCTFYEAGIVDDTLIFLRYAENALSGVGVVFNAGDRVEGYTSPLWLLLLIIGGLLPLNLDSLALGLSSAFGIASVLLVLFEGGRRGGFFLSFCVALILCVAPPFVYWTHSGMGTALFAFLLTLFFLFLERDSRASSPPLRSGFLLSLCILSRPEAAALVPLGSAWIYFSRRGPGQNGLKAIGAFLSPLIIIVLHLLWRFSYYDSLLPNTYFAKAGIPLSARLSSGLSYSLNFFKAYAVYLLVTAVGILLALRNLLGKEKGNSIRDLTLPGLLVANWVLVVIYSGGDHFAMYRFFVPILPLLSLLGLRILRHALERSEMPKTRYVYSSLGILAALILGYHFRRSDVISVIESLLLIIPALLIAYALRSSAKLQSLFPHNNSMVATGLLVLLAFTLNFQFAMNSRDARTAKYEVTLVDTWTRVGLWLKSHVPADTTIAAITMGAIPYRSGLKTLDLVGLTDRTIARKGNIKAEAATGHQKYLSEYVLRSGPQIIVHPSAAATKKKLESPGSNLVEKWHYSILDLLKHREMRESYDLQHFELEDAQYMVLFVRKDFSGLRSSKPAQ